ncbi:class II aldolase/adducin family protein [Helicobacter sp.]|uniref:class II aldolase/adducin family protein n=1 Tax=Helicobacter sp. TaxID=218 RepID=UPI0025BB085F|nr:class II aldolase/adducin family protein [Helicobacter sp.]MBR2494257.1 class II aldolase/adducin family protein [Helicobacter sp.]
MNIHTKNIDSPTINYLADMAHSLCQSGLLGVFYGSISARLGANSFLINRKDALLDKMDHNSFITLHDKEDYRWQEASLDSFIHANIYRNFLEARFVVYSHAPYATSYSLKHDVIKPIDYLGCRILGRTSKILDSKEYETLYERADTDIVRYFKTNATNFVLLKGCGIYGYGRDLSALVKLVSVVENSCKILHFNNIIDQSYTDESLFEI